MSHSSRPAVGITRFLLSIAQIRSDQLLSRVRLFATPWIAARQASLSITNSRSSPAKVCCCKSLQQFASLLLFSLLVMSDSLWSHGLQGSRLPCPSLSPRVCSRLMSIESMMPSNHLILCRPLLLLPSIFPSIRVFSNESALCMQKFMFFEIH